MMRLFAVLSIAAWVAVAPLRLHGQDWVDERTDVRSRLDRLDRVIAALELAAPSENQSAAFLTGALANDVPSLEERVQRLETELKKQGEAEAKRKAADALKPTQRWTGRIQADYWAFPQTSPGANAFETGDPDEKVPDRFLFRRLRIGIQGTIPDNMLYKLEVDFNNPNNPQLKDDYLGWEDLPWLQTVLVGNQKRPYGLDHINSSRFNVFLERPVIVEAFNQDARRFGIQSWGVSEDEAFNWRYGAFLSQQIQDLGTVFATQFGAYQAELAGRLANTIWYDEASDGRGYAHWAIAGTTARTDPHGIPQTTADFRSRPEARTEIRWLDTGPILGADYYNLLGLEGVLNLGPVQCVGEFQQVWMHRISAEPLQFSGGYFYVAWFLTGEHMVWDRKTGQLGRAEPFTNFFRVRTVDGSTDGGWGAWQVAVRYSHGDLSDLNVHGGISDEITFGLNWYFDAHAKLQFNCISGNIHDRRPVDGLTAANFTILGTRLAVDF